LIEIWSGLRSFQHLFGWPPTGRPAYSREQNKNFIALAMNVYSLYNIGHGLSSGAVFNAEEQPLIPSRFRALRVGKII
jgi:hypothetical protein